MVSPDETLEYCEHFTESELFGHIDSSARDNDVIAVWKKHMPLGKEYTDCLYYPKCIRLKICPGKQTCTALDCENKENQLRSQVLNEYRIYMEQKMAK